MRTNGVTKIALLVLRTGELKMCVCRTWQEQKFKMNVYWFSSLDHAALTWGGDERGRVRLLIQQSVALPGTLMYAIKTESSNLSCHGSRYSHF